MMLENLEAFVAHWEQTVRDTNSTHDQELVLAWARHQHLTGRIPPEECVQEFDNVFIGVFATRTDAALHYINTKWARHPLTRHTNIHSFAWSTEFLDRVDLVNISDIYPYTPIMACTRNSATHNQPRGLAEGLESCKTVRQ